MHQSILITGANGQLGTVLTESLQLKYGVENVIASDLREKASYTGIFEYLDVTDSDRLEEVILKYNVKEIYHLAAILSANGERNPLNTWEINMRALLNVLEASRKNNVEKVFHPSSIAVFGESAPPINTPNNSLLDPLTSYGLSKAAGENWGKYYFYKYGLDVRSLRYPGLIGYQSRPGGGTTDYAVEIYHKAVAGESFTCFLDRETTLPMMYIDDAVRATLELMEAPRENIKVRTSYNIAGISFSPAQVAASIKEKYPDFEIEYAPDHRQEIADQWPKSIQDLEAMRDWSWKPQFNLPKITEVMIDNLEREHEHFI
ncbi:NAD-dependent epimerase/dehydratase family protein [Flagellimonas myxillae]|uniref:NAD-dependent epimerase/dehydratase family protein n=1 Tax=Flagellimonas myxillae TaxID=2942214 RepID=UPI00201F02C6|nr:NAD-dependent epimerase/dehydratase family protein [Muricauda myxillae]MCL6267875.1 NAD-dependent epimerase/dehydratase family protein [Muricauda myxillae]